MTDLEKIADLIKDADSDKKYNEIINVLTLMKNDTEHLIDLCERLK
jgi:aspartokinase